MLHSYGLVPHLSKRLSKLLLAMRTYLWIWVVRTKYAYIYIYIYIYCHPQTDCFVQSELFSVARHVGHSKPGSKPIQLYVRLSLRPLGQQVYHVWLRELLRYYVVTAAAVCWHFYTLSATRELSSFEELCIMQAATENSFTSVLNPHSGAYILSSTDRLFRSLRSRDRNPSNFTLD